MKNFYIWTFLLLISLINIKSFGQKTYIGHGKVNGPFPCYSVTVIEINTDNSYTRTDYKCGGKSDIKNYKTCDSESSNGRIEKISDYFTMTEYRENLPTSIKFDLEITDKAMTFWSHKEIRKKKYKGLKLKRISHSDI